MEANARELFWNQMRKMALQPKGQYMHLPTTSTFSTIKTMVLRVPKSNKIRLDPNKPEAFSFIYI